MTRPYVRFSLPGHERQDRHERYEQHEPSEAPILEAFLDEDVFFFSFLFGCLAGDFRGLFRGGGML